MKARRSWRLLPPGLAAGAATVSLLLVPGTGVAAASGQSGSGGRISTSTLHSAGRISSASLPANLQVVATGLNQPRKVTIGPNGDLFVTEAGLNSPVPAGCTSGAEQACANPSGAIAEVTPAGVVTTVVPNLPSVNGGPGSAGAAGPSGITIERNHIQYLIQNLNIDPTTGDETYGAAGTLLGDLLQSPVVAGGSPPAPALEAQLGPYEAQNNPDHGAGAVGGEPAIDSDPYAVIAYQGGYAIADAAANDVLFFKNGKLSTLAVMPLVSENGGQAQSVPTTLAVGPDGHLYIGELGGVENGNDVGVAHVYKLVNGHLVTVASGLTTIVDIAFDQAGRLLVLELDQNGLEDMSSPPQPGALIRINHDGTRTMLASNGLLFPGGLAVAKDGSVYVTNFSIFQGANDPSAPPGVGGEIVRVSDNSPADQIGANYGGYREVAKDGGVFTFGKYGFYGSLGGIKLNKPIVAAVQNPLRPGYWMAGSDGGVFSFGDSAFYGSTGGIVLDKPVNTIAATPDGKGYFLFASDGGVFNYGDAVFHGSLGDQPLIAPVVAATVTPDGGGYYLFASDGGVFAFGDARFRGSLGGVKLDQPIVSGSATPDGKGYYLFASDGGVFCFGDANFHGSLGGVKLAQPVVAGTVTPNNGGYEMAASDGGIFAFGNAQFYGSTGGIKLDQPVVSFG
jgi:hypothetical protein